MKQFIKERIEFICILISWVVAGVYIDDNVAVLLMSASILLLKYKGRYIELILGFMMILVLSDNRNWSMEWTGNAKNVYIVLLSLIAIFDRKHFTVPNKLFLPFVPFLIYAALIVYKNPEPIIREVDINFLEKMIQVDFDLPVIEQTEIDRMIMKSLDEIVKDEDIHLLPETSDRLYKIYKKHVSGLAITNLRSAKGYLNAVTFSLPLIKNEVDYADFLLLEVIRVFYPEIHEIVYVHKEHFISYDPIVWDERATFRYETPPEIKGFFEKLQRTLSGYDTVSEQVIKGLLRKLFPTYNAYQENPSEPSPVKYSRDNVVHKRLADTARGWAQALGPIIEVQILRQVAPGGDGRDVSRAPSTSATTGSCHGEAPPSRGTRSLSEPRRPPTMPLARVHHQRSLIRQPKRQGE